MNLPRISYLTPGPAAPDRSLAVAAAPARAMGEIGRELFRAGTKGFEIAERVRESAEAGMRAKFMSEVEREAALFDANLEGRADYDEWGNDFKTKADQWRARANELGLSRQGKEILDQQLVDYSTKSEIRTATQAAVMKHRNGVAMVELSYSQHAQLGDQDGMARDLQEAERLGVPPAKIAEMQAKGQEVARKSNLVRSIRDNPAAALEKFKDPKFRGSLPPSEMMGLEDLARTELRQQTADASLDIFDAIDSNNIHTDKEIDDLTPEMRPHARQPLYNYLKQRANAEHQDLAATPEYQSKVAGEVAARMAEYRANGENADQEYVGILGQIYTLPTGSAMRVHLTKKLNALKSGQEQEVKTALDRAEKALDGAFKDGRFGKIDASNKKAMPVAELLHAGILSDTAKLQARGFLPEQAAIIAKDDVKEADLVKMGFSPLEAKRSAGPGLQARVSRYHAFAGRPRVNADTLDPWNQGAFDALDDSTKDGSKQVYEFPDAEAEDAAITAREDAYQAAGNARTRLLEFARANPDAKDSDYQKEVALIAGEEVANQMRAAKFPSFNSPKGADVNTSSTPVGKDIKDVVKHFEAGGAAGGFHREAYWDNKQWSIGYGTKATKGETITKEEAEKRLDSELSKHRARVEDRNQRFGLNLKPHQIDALTSFDFNTGLLDQLLAGGTRSPAIIAEKMLLYRNASGQRLRGLERRRRAEAALFLQGYAD